MVYGTGTHVRNWRSRSGYGGTTTSQTLVGGLASPPERRSVLWPLMILFVLSGVFTVLQTFVRDQQGVDARARAAAVSGRAPTRHRHGMLSLQPVTHQSAFPDAQWEVIGDGIVVVWTGVGVLMGAIAVRAVWFNRRVYPGAFARWSQSFMCRGCGTVFAAPDSGLTALPRR